ncbi:hypothetical protein DL93DRAFT_1731892 [Clavulina sp. PMI_390]|nr:hypothetical protein DL93DRAFT_1731892 [Clavulina sp. PMI_390]
MAVSTTKEEVMSALSSQVDAMTNLLNASIPSAIPNILELGRDMQGGHKANMTSHIARLDEFHHEFQNIVSRGFSAIAALRDKLNVARSPFHVLPMETMSEIFRHVVQPERGRARYLGISHEPEPRSVLILSHVSRAWRAVVLSLTDVFTASPDWDTWPLWLCREWYNRSSDRPISMGISSDFFERVRNGPHGAELLNTWSELAPRTKSLTIEGPLGEFVGGLEDLVKIPIFSSLSHISLLDIEGPVNLPPYIIASLQSMTVRDFHNCHIRIMGQERKVPLLHSLERLRIIFTERSEYESHWVDLVECSPRISTLELVNTNRTNQRIPIREVLTYGKPNLSDVQTLSFARLCTEDVDDILQCWRFPALKTITLDGASDFNDYWDCTRTFMILDRSAPNLTSIVIINTQLLIKDAVVSLTNTPHELSSLTELTLEDPHFDWSSHPPLDGNGMEAELVALVKSRRLQRLTVFFPSSEEATRELRAHVGVLEVQLIEFTVDPAIRLPALENLTSAEAQTSLSPSSWVPRSMRSTGTTPLDRSFKPFFLGLFQVYLTLNFDLSFMFSIPSASVMFSLGSC